MTPIFSIVHNTAAYTVAAVFFMLMLFIVVHACPQESLDKPRIR